MEFPPWFHDRTMARREIGSQALSRLRTARRLVRDPTPRQSPAEKAVTPRPIEYGARKVINGADTAWLLTATALVLLMTLPALALLLWRAGPGQEHPVGAGAVLSRSPACVSVLWFAFGYSLAYRGDGAWLGRSAARFFLPEWRAAPSHPGTAYSRKRLCDVPDDLRDHHAGADHRRLCRAHPLRRGAADFRRCGFWSSMRPVAHWVWGGGWLADARRDGFRRRHRRACHRRRFGAGDRLDARAAP